jgi:hypothetical protein
MSEEIKENNAPAKEPAEDTGKQTSSAEQIKKPKKKKTGKIKWILLIIAVLPGISGLGIKYAPDRFSYLMKKKFDTPDVSIDEDHLREEILSPFFLPPGPTSDTIRIDLSIIWDGLASIRFKKKELSVRNMMYEKFHNIAEQNRNLNEKIPYLENEVSSMLRSSLGVQNLTVKIKEIRYF